MKINLAALLFVTAIWLGWNNHLGQALQASLRMLLGLMG